MLFLILNFNLFMPVFKNTWGKKKVTLLCHSLISINKVREKLQLGMEQEMGGFKVIMLLSLAALIQTPMAQQEVCEPKSASSFAVLPLSSFALVQIAFLITGTEEMQHVASSSEMMRRGSYLASCITSCKQLLRNEADLLLIPDEWHCVSCVEGQGHYIIKGLLIFFPLYILFLSVDVHMVF